MQIVGPIGFSATKITTEHKKWRNKGQTRRQLRKGNFLCPVGKKGSAKG